MKERATERGCHWQLFISFLKIGLFTIGGGYAMVPLIEREVVTNRGWVEGKDFLDLLTLAQSIPGPIALNTSTFVGYNRAGYSGALAALLGIIVPSFVIILLVAIFFTTIRDNAIIEAAFKAMRPVVIALILSPVISFLKGMRLISIVVVGITTLLIAMVNVSPAVMILIAAVGSVVWTLLITQRNIAKIKEREEGLK